MKRRILPFLLLMGIPFLALRARAETEQIDLKALAKKARPAVMLLVVSDANGKEIATGTGFLVSSDGKLITNRHVTREGYTAIAKADNGTKFIVVGVLAEDLENDLVLLRLGPERTGKSGEMAPNQQLPNVDLRDLPCLSLHGGEEIEVGARVAVIGSPLGLEGTLTEGIVSSFRDFAGQKKMLQITAAISPGSSGSPVLNSKGEVIGIATSIARGGQSINFAIPVGTARSLLSKDTGKLLSLSAESDRDFVLCQQLPLPPQEKLDMIKRVVRRFPENQDAYAMMALFHSQLARNTQAVADALAGVRAKPDSFESWDSLGGAYDALGEYASAAFAYREALTLSA